MTVRLRAHHLLCLLTYVGKGYSPAFTANYDVIAGRIAGGEDIRIVTGPDDVCAPLLDCPDAHCRRESVDERDRLAAGAVAGLLRRAVVPGALLRLEKSDRQRMRTAFAAGQIRAACEGCEWHALCSEIACSGFHSVRLPS